MAIRRLKRRETHLGSSAVQNACTARVEPLSSLNHVTIYVVRNPDDAG
jgi:hypothetical protein